jgi:hypothetical protein
MNPTECIEVPHFVGYRCLGRGSPRIGQFYLTGEDVLVESTMYFLYDKYIVYEKLQPKRYVFEAVGDKPTYPKQGDWFISDRGELLFCDYEQFPEPRIVLKKVEE